MTGTRILNLVLLLLQLVTCVDHSSLLQEELTTILRHRVFLCTPVKEDALPLRFWMMPLWNNPERELEYCSGLAHHMVLHTPPTYTPTSIFKTMMVSDI